MGQNKKVRFSVRREYVVEIDLNTLVRCKMAYRQAYPDVSWDDDEAVINAIVEDYAREGKFDDQVIGPWVVVLRSTESTLTRP